MPHYIVALTNDEIQEMKECINTKRREELPYKACTNTAEVESEAGKVDSVHVRNGVMDVFMVSESLAGRRETVVTQTWTNLTPTPLLLRIRHMHQKKPAI